MITTISITTMILIMMQQIINIVLLLLSVPDGGPSSGADAKRQTQW